ncbi:hypothetical protein [Amnibacterium kyonggiense]|uniref:Uncharacterized protein n=1 Tax=Amnibacterium kyonggiense TaxID=595671 RepID=A0A4V3EBF1_9MICO|nr:hypothetical protein [Amnibacterium kyonggiense]TDS80844.1 hypothetical protein CLV52_1414 [Amnibacterium kyonggiense]
MADETDAVLLEAVRTHRSRLRGAFLLGELAERRAVHDNVKRVVGSLVLAAVVCAGCVGTSLVLHALATQQTGAGR